MATPVPVALTDPKRVYTVRLSEAQRQFLVWGLGQRDLRMATHDHLSPEIRHLRAALIEMVHSEPDEIAGLAL